MTVAQHKVCFTGDDGATVHSWMSDLFPICRSITGDGTRKTLQYLQELLPGMTIHSVPSGTNVFDWTVPDEWNIRDAYVADVDGNRVIDFQQHNLHVVGYSEPVNKRMTFNELKDHLHTLPDQPTAIPYITSYYKRRWGFCLTQTQYDALAQSPDAEYDVVIDSALQPGELNYGELLIPGESSQEVFFSTYVCHPSMANNELSGPCVQAALARKLLSREHRSLSYRFYFGAETIGAISYLSQNLPNMQKNMLAGFVLSCIGDDRTYSYQASREGDTLADRVAQHVLKHTVPKYQTYTFLDRGSDERQYCSPGVDLPVCTLSRSKFMTYPEYHTSLDDLNLVTPDGLQGSLDLLCGIVDALEANAIFENSYPCEPQLGKRGLYPSLSTKDTRKQVAKMMNLLAYADGRRDLLSIAEKIGAYIGELIPLVDQFVKADVLRKRSCS